MNTSQIASIQIYNVIEAYFDEIEVAFSESECEELTKRILGSVEDFFG